MTAASPARPRLLPVTLLRTRIVSPMNTGPLNCHSRIAMNASVRIGGLVTARPLPIAKTSSPWAIGRRNERGLGKLVVDVDGIEVAAEAGEVDDVGLGDRSRLAQPFLAHLHVIEEEMLFGEGHAPILGLPGRLQPDPGWFISMGSAACKAIGRV